MYSRITGKIINLEIYLRSIELACKLNLKIFRLLRENARRLNLSMTIAAGFLRFLKLKTSDIEG